MVGPRCRRSRTPFQLFTQIAWRRPEDIWQNAGRLRVQDETSELVGGTADAHSRSEPPRSQEVRSDELSHIVGNSSRRHLSSWTRPGAGERERAPISPLRRAATGAPPRTSSRHGSSTEVAIASSASGRRHRWREVDCVRDIPSDQHDRSRLLVPVRRISASHDRRCRRCDERQDSACRSSRPRGYTTWLRSRATASRRGLNRCSLRTARTTGAERKDG